MACALDQFITIIVALPRVSEADVASTNRTA